MADLDLTRLDGGTRANVMCAVEALGRLGNFVGAALDLVDSTPFQVSPEEGRSIGSLIENARDEMDTLRAHLGDLVKAEDLSRLDGPAPAAPHRSPAFRMEVVGDDDLPGSGAIKPMDLWEQAAPACNAASDARDLSMVLVRALGTYDLGFGPDELAALYTVAGMVAERTTEAADRADAVCALVEPLAQPEMGRASA